MLSPTTARQPSPGTTKESRLEVCPFCSVAQERVIEEADHAFAMLDAYPVSPGHTLIVVRRHVANVFELEEEELAAVVQLIRSVRERIDREYEPAGYNIGINVGQAAGQTIMHVHFHIIPRYFGDSADPTGGVRNAIPGKGRYMIDVGA
jgi:diadenosine tetraphosphate (Ap4A) HIT family hydrolase